MCQEGPHCYAAQLHVVFLLSLGVDLALGLVQDEEVPEYALIDVVADGVPDLLHVLVELGDGPAWPVGVEREELLDESARLVLLEQEGHHLVHQVRHDVAVIVCPFHAEV